MQWIHATDMAKLSSRELYQILKLRQDVFIIEQKCIYEDIDNIDPYCEHLLLKKDEQFIGCSRIVPANKKFSHPSIGRIAVHKNFRKKGYGKEIVLKALSILSAKKCNVVIIEAQNYLESFYESLGFQKVSDPYDVDGILHIKMTHTF